MIDEIYSAILYFVNRFFLYVLCSSYWIIIDSFGYICHNSASRLILSAVLYFYHFFLE